MEALVGILSGIAIYMIGRVVGRAEAQLAFHKNLHSFRKSLTWEQRGEFNAWIKAYEARWTSDVSNSDKKQ